MFRYLLAQRQQENSMQVASAPPTLTHTPSEPSSPTNTLAYQQQSSNNQNSSSQPQQDVCGSPVFNQQTTGYMQLLQDNQYVPGNLFRQLNK